MTSFILIHLKALLPFYDLRRNAGHLISQGEFGLEFFQDRVGLVYFEPEAVEHEHEMVGKLLGKIPGVYGDIQIRLDLRHDLLRKRADRLIEPHLLHGAKVCRRAHSRDGQEGEDLLFHREINVQDPSDPVDQLIQLEKLAVGCQIIVGVRQFADEMAGEKAVHHKEQIALEPLSHLFLKCLLFERFPDQFLDFLIQRVIAVQGVKAVFQHVSADIQFLPVKDHSLTRLSHYAQAEGLDLLAELLQIADQSSPAHIHLVSEFICEERCVRPHQLSEHISLPPPRRAEKTVYIAYFLKSAFVLFRVKNPQAVASLIPLNGSASAQILVQLPDIIADRPLADAQFLCHRGDSNTGFMSENLQYFRCPVVCKSFVHLLLPPLQAFHTISLMLLYNPPSLRVNTENFHSVERHPSMLWKSLAAL